MRTDEPVAGYGYWDEHPDFPVCDWQYEVQSGDTRQGYWPWVRALARIEEDGAPNDRCTCGHPRSEHSFGTPQGCGHVESGEFCDCQEWNPA